MIILYRLYQLCICFPLLLLATFITAIVTLVGSTLGKAHFWGYYPGHLWSKFFCWLLLLPVKVNGDDLIDHKTSYVFVANHQGSFDIFLIYGYLGRNFKWMMKKSLRKMFLVGKACEAAGHIFVDNSSPRKVAETIDNARKTLKNGTSLVVFPEGRRTETGKMGPFKRGAYQLADELQLPVVPMTIDGSWNVLPRTKGFNFVTWHRLVLTIHKPILPTGKGQEEVKVTMQQSREAINSALPAALKD